MTVLELVWAILRVVLSISLGAFLVGRYEGISWKVTLRRLAALIRDAFLARGNVSRSWFVYAGVALVILKTSVDVYIRGIKSLLITENWLTAMPIDSAGLFAALPAILWSIPFIWVGTGLCIMRLRDAALPRVLVPLFFVPGANLIFFVVCASVPSAGDGHDSRLEASSRSFFGRMLPESDLGTAAFAVVQCAVLGVLGVLAGAYGLGNYGAPLFLGLPFFMGFLSSLLYGVRTQRTLRECWVVANMSLMLAAAGLVCLLIEGLVCIAALLPLAAVLVWIGALVGYSVQLRPPGDSGRTQSPILCGLALAAALALPVPNSQTLTAVTTIIIDRPPREVWPHVVAFSEIEPPNEWLFLQGVAYPIRARIEGQGVGAVRYCEFSTGPFVEPITVWNEPRELRFTVTKTPPALTEYNPLGQVIAPHLDGYFESLGGQFLLSEVAPSKTEIRATTWYTHKVAPVWYWELISEPILHLIHSRVLEHIKATAEAPLLRQGAAAELARGAQKST